MGGRLNNHPRLGARGKHPLIVVRNLLDKDTELTRYELACGHHRVSYGYYPRLKRLFCPACTRDAS